MTALPMVCGFILVESGLSPGCSYAVDLQGLAARASCASGPPEFLSKFHIPAAHSLIVKGPSSSRMSLKKGALPLSGEAT